MAAAGSAAFAIPAAALQLPEPERCGTPTAQPRTVDRRDGDPERGFAPISGVPVGLPQAVPAQPLPLGSQATLPSAPTATQATPPSGGTLPTPAVPGLAPAGQSEEEEDTRERVQALQAQGPVEEARLLDVGIELFGSGAPEGDREKLARVGLSPELRRSESRYVSFHLKKTLESTGYWGAVRVLPGPGEGLDLTVTGRIRESNGKRLVLDVEAYDARGERWLDKRYRGAADTSAYRTDRVGRQEAFQEVYNRIANDLLHALQKRDDETLDTVRRIGGLRFASQLLPEAFAPYLKSSGSGRYTLVRLPAADDPMTGRVASIRERDQMLVDTLNDHYLTHYEKMSGPYASWKMNSYQEQDALDRIQRASLLKKILGGAALLTGILMSPDSQGEAAARDAAIIGGSLVMQSGFQQAREKGVHQAALKELATSFDGDVAPLLVEVEGRQLELTGPAERQFVAWRELLRQVFSLETGAPDDPNAVVVMSPTSQP
jgi:hypothetical protein